MDFFLKLLSFHRPFSDKTMEINHFFMRMYVKPWDSRVYFYLCPIAGQVYLICPNCPSQSIYTHTPTPACPDCNKTPLITRYYAMVLRWRPQTSNECIQYSTHTSSPIQWSFSWVTQFAYLSVKVTLVTSGCGQGE